MGDAARGRSAWLPGLVACLTLGGVVTGQGQAPSRDTVAVVGWIPADGVRPDITVNVTRSAATGLWIYRYLVVNRATASQDLVKLVLVLNAPVISVSTPTGWHGLAYNPPGALPGVTLTAKRGPVGRWIRPVVPGGTPLRFEIVSRAGPGTVRYYARGGVPAMALDSLSHADRARVPDEEQDAIRDSTVGPSR
jgi:hypothetical protein